MEYSVKLNEQDITLLQLGVKHMAEALLTNIALQCQKQQEVEVIRSVAAAVDKPVAIEDPVVIVEDTKVQS